MRLARILSVPLFLLAAASAVAATRPASWAPPQAERPANPATVVEEDDADVPPFARDIVDKEAYMRARNQYFEDRNDAPFEVGFTARLDAIRAMERQASQQGPFVVFGSWTPIGPFPIPNGQTTTVTTPVSGRCTAIAVHPTNPDIVYVGAAQGGVWRSLNGGTTWTPIFDGAASLAVSALALSPSNPSILYVGTGESSGSCDSYYGVGLYRIDNADTAPVLNGPFNSGLTNQPGFVPFTGRAISAIAVHPTNPDIVFCSTVSAIGGIGCDAPGTGPPALGLRGVTRSMNATSASPSFEYLAFGAATNVATYDMKLDPNDPNKLVVAGLVGSGIYVSTNALAATPTFVGSTNGTFSNRCELAVTSQAGVTTWMAAIGTGNGSTRRSADALTWTNVAGGANFCSGQCFYDIAIAMPPEDAQTVLLGGSSGANLYKRSTNGGTTFTASATGLHADVHALTVAPSDPNRVYLGCDGGVYRSNDRGITWTSVNTAGFSVTQFQSIALHPIDPNFTIGGTQDNGTNWYKPDGTWIRADFGDGGFTAIDQNAVDNTNVTMYHTYFNQTNAMGYSRVTNTGSASDGLWQLFGCGFGGSTPNGMTCTATACLFYAPVAQGPGSPNTLYFGSDVLYRSSNAGVTMTKVSQEPIVSAVAISAIGIAPQNDNVRLVGLRNGRLFGTVTGSSTLTDMGAGLPAKYIARCTIDPTNANVAYVSFAGFGLAAGAHVYKTTNLLSGTPTWALAGNGIPDVPVNAFVIDPVTPTNVYAGTDVGVYRSTDGGANWSPFTTGMPVVAVFDMAIQGPSRILRVATHGRGMFERLLDAPVATELALVGSEIVGGKPRLTWFSADGAGEAVTVYRRPVPGDWETAATTYVNGTGLVSYEDASAVPGRSYEYEVGLRNGGREVRLGRVWVDVPFGRGLAVKSSGGLRFALTLPTAEHARLELVDVTGRRIREMDLGSRQPGDVEIALDANGVQPGVYWARLMQAGRMASTRVTLLQSN